MTHRAPLAPVLAVVAVAVGTGAIAGAVGAAFIWVVDVGIDLLWDRLPASIDAGWWWVVAVPVAGGAFVGLGQRFLGNHPAPIRHYVAAWRSGGGIDAKDTPASLANSLSALVFGGPLGFEAALTGVVGGVGAWAGDSIGRAGHLLRQSWGWERVEQLPPALRKLPPWLAALAGVLTFRWLPFGSLHFGVEIPEPDTASSIVDALSAFGTAAVLAVPVAWLLVAVARSEEATLFRRSPIAIAVGGGLVVGLLALGSDLVLFSGQAGLGVIAETSTAELAYAGLAKAVALVVVYMAGWRGGPIFPLWFVAASLGAVAARGIGLDGLPVAVAAVATVGVAFFRGKVVPGVLLTMILVPFSAFGAVIAGAVGAATGLAVAGSAGLVPSVAPDGQAGPGHQERDEGGGTGDRPEGEVPEHEERGDDPEPPGQ